MASLEDNIAGEDVTWECDDEAISIYLQMTFLQDRWKKLLLELNEACGSCVLLNQ